MNLRRERFLGCLLGGAVGDALGAPVEFLSRAKIRQRFGPEGITDYAPAYGGIGRITDDTQMTLFTAEAMLRTWVRGCNRGFVNPVAVAGHAYLRWLRTQGEAPHGEREPDPSSLGWLFQHRSLHARRAPGITCLNALRSKARSADPAANDSKGCGGVMRVAPIGLYAARVQNPPDIAFKWGADIAGLTHGHPTGKWTAGVFAVLIQRLAEGSSLSEALDVAKALLREVPDHAETLHALDTAESLAASGTIPDDALPHLGQGWVAEEALAISVYCALLAHDFWDGVTLAVNHDGDSDSTGSITGNLLGTLEGVAAIPSRWLEHLELRDAITEMAEDLYDFPDWNIGEGTTDPEFDEKIFEKYPGS